MHAILAQGAMSPTHDELAQIAGIGSRTVGTTIRSLGPSATRMLTAGHPARLGPGLGFTLGLSIGAQSVHGALVDANGEMHAKHSATPEPGQLELSPAELLLRVRTVARQVLAEAVSNEDLWGPVPYRLELHGVAVSWPSPLDRFKRPGGWTLRHRAWRDPRKDTGVPLTVPEHLATAFGTPFDESRCHAIQDVNAHALNIAFHDSRSRAHMTDNEMPSMWRVVLVLRVGDRLGASVILLAPPSLARLSFIDSILIEGSRGFAGELGHLGIEKRVIAAINDESVTGLAKIDYERWRCSCGLPHHLEAFASVPALVRRLQASNYDIPADGVGRELLLKRGLKGIADEVQTRAGVDIGRILGHALAGPVLMLNPSSVIVTGPLSSIHVVRGIEREGSVWANAIDDSVEIGLDTSQAGDHIGVRGAGLALLRSRVYRGFLDKRADGLDTISFGGPELEDF